MITTLAECANHRPMTKSCRKRVPKNVSKLPVWQFNVRLVDCYSESRVTATEDSLLFALMILVVLSQRIAEPLFQLVQFSTCRRLCLSACGNGCNPVSP